MKNKEKRIKLEYNENQKVGLGIFHDKSELKLNKPFEELNKKNLTPKEEAEKLLYESYKKLGNIETFQTMENAKQCALIEVDGILKIALNIANDESIMYWQEVKQEINKL
jgi:hypothetical protein